MFAALQNLREVTILRRYHIQKREDYVKYNRLVGDIRKMVAKLTSLDAKDPVRVKTTQQFLEKLCVIHAALRLISPPQRLHADSTWV